MQVIAEGLLTSYERSGKGRTVVVLHGWGDRAAGLRGISSALAKNFDVIVPDLPGFGASEAPHEAWGLDEYSQFVGNFLKKIGIDHIYGLIGHSNGGAIAARGLSRHVLMAERLVMLASAGIRGEYKGRVKALRYVTKAGKILTIPFPATLKHRLRRKVYDSIGSDMLVAEHLQETFKRVVTDDIRADVSQLNLPVLLIYGSADKAAPVRYGKIFSQLMENARLEVLPGTGHFVHIEKGEEVTKEIEEFLA